MDASICTIFWGGRICLDPEKKINSTIKANDKFKHGTFDFQELTCLCEKRET